MIVRRGRNLDGPLLCRLGVSGQYPGHKFTLESAHQALVFDAEACFLPHQLCDFGLLQEEFVKPCNL